MPKLHITLGINSLQIEDATDLNFSPAIMAMITSFLHRASGPEVTQDAIDSLAEKLKGQNDALETLVAAHTAP